MNVYIHTLLNEEFSAQIKEVFGADHFISFRNTSGVSPEPPEVFLKADAILGNPPLSWLSGDGASHGVASHLKFWQLDSAGFDQYKSVKTTAKVANMGDWYAWPCAETIVAGVLALYRGLNRLVLLQQEKKWVGAPLREELHLINRKNVVILGAGTIGRAVKSIVAGFGAFPRLVARSSPDADIHSRAELLELLPSTDIVINTLPGAAGTYVDAEFLSAMKKGSVYANVGRGTTTDEAALIRALSEGLLAGAVLDVTEKEPLPAGSPLWEMENVILTQHTGGGRANENQGKVDNFIRNFSHILKGEDIDFEVSLSQGY